MKTKKKEHMPSRFTRGEKVVAKKGHHGRKSMGKKEEAGSYGLMRKLDEEIMIA